MSLQEDLRRISKRAHRELDSVHDFFDHSIIVWRSFGTFVDEGHKVASENVATGTRIDQDGLLRLAPQYMREYLSTFTFRQFVSAFEVFLFDFLHRLFLHNPWQFARCQLDFEAVLRAGDRDEVISGVIARQLNELKYANPREWFAALDRAVHLGCPTADEIDTLAEIKATRDVLEHSAGVVNETYLRKAARKARHAAGDALEIDANYHLESWRLIKKVVTDVTDAAVAKLSKP